MDPPWRDRVDAGQRLADLVEPWCAENEWHAPIVLGVPRGGVVVAAEVADRLHAPLGVAVVRKLGAPTHPEFAVGAIAEGIRVVSPDALRDTRTGPEQLDFVEAVERVELARRTDRYAAGSVDVRGRDVIVVDDGVATGSTATAACAAVHAAGAARVVLVVPVAPASWHPDPSVIPECLCLLRPARFWAVGQFYTRFAPTTDAEVEALLVRC